MTRYVYTAMGEKLRVIHYKAPENIQVEMGKADRRIESIYLSVDTTDYLMSGQLLLRNGRIDKFLFGGGYAQARRSGFRVLPINRNAFKYIDENGNITFDEEAYLRMVENRRKLMKKHNNTDYFKFYYYNKDHLGNIREVIDPTGRVVQTNDYYPFGAPYSDGTPDNASFQKYKYNGKELDMMHGLNTYDYGARQYCSILPMWDRVDPLCEKYYHISPYAYCGNNPVRFVDPDGREIDLSHMSEEERKRFESQLTLQREKSKLFDTMYTSLENSKDVYVT